MSSAKLTPKFGGGGEKCKTCAKTVYPQERISYDNGTWHQLCFKCQSCRSTLSLTAVAMINGDLYCKTCFKKIFMREGKYSSFETARTLPKDFREAAASSSSPPPSASPPPLSSPPPPELSLPHPTRSASTSLPRSSSLSVSSPTSSSSSLPPTSSNPLTSLQSAIEQKDLPLIHSLLNAHGASLLFARVKGGVTLLEWALGNYMYKGMGGKMVEWLEERVGKAERVMQEAGVGSNPLKGTKAGEEGEEAGQTKAPVEEAKEAEVDVAA